LNYFVDMVCICSIVNLSAANKLPKQENLMKLTDFKNHSVTFNGYTGYKEISKDDLYELAFNFKTEKQSKDFSSKFPKYCKARCVKVCVYHGDAYFQTCFFFTTHTEKLTGKTNESADKRQKKIFQVLGL